MNTLKTINKMDQIDKIYERRMFLLNIEKRTEIKEVKKAAGSTAFDIFLNDTLIALGQKKEVKTDAIIAIEAKYEAKMNTIKAEWKTAKDAFYDEIFGENEIVVKEPKKKVFSLKEAVERVKRMRESGRKLTDNKKIPKMITKKEATEDAGKKIYVMIDPKEYEGNGHAYKEETLKPAASHICNGLKKVEVNIKTLVNSLCTGHAVRLGTYGKQLAISKTGKEYYAFNPNDFRGTTAFYVDVDNGGSMERSLEIAKQYKLNIAAILPSVSFTEENQKHHMLFILDKPTFNESEINNIVSGILTLFDADKSCGYISKFLYPSWNKPYYTNYTATNDIEYLKDLTNRIKNTKISKVKTAEIVDITNFEDDKKGTLRIYPILNSYYIYKYKINMGGETNDTSEQPSNIAISMLDRLLNDEIFVKRYGFKSFNSIEDIKIYLKSIPLEDLLQIDNPSSFKCLFHQDNNPSAAIRMLDNISVYTCFTGDCIGSSNDIFNIVSYMLTGSTDNFMDAFMYIVNALELTIADVNLDFYKKVTETIKNNRYLALTANTLGEDFKNVRRKLESKYTNMLVRTLMDIAEYTLDHCPRIAENDELIFTASASFLKDRAGFSDTKLINERMDDLVAIGFIEQLTDDEVKKINRNVYNSIMDLQKKNFYSKAKTINCYRLKRVDTPALAAAEDLFKYSKQIGATRKGTSATQNRIVGINARKKANRTLKGKDKEMFELLEGWFTRTYKRNKYVLKELYLKYASKNNIGEKKASSFLAEFNINLGLNKRIVGKDLIKEYDIPATNLRRTVFI